MQGSEPWIVRKSREFSCWTRDSASQAGNAGLRALDREKISWLDQQIGLPGRKSREFSWLRPIYSKFYGMVEPLLLGIVIGLVCISVAGLFVAAIGNWALSARLMLLLTVCWFYTPRVIQN